MTDDDAPFLSLVTPVYNGAGYIAANVTTIIAALEALDAPFEVIVVCDGSTDESAVHARSVDDPRLTVLRLDVNGGKGEAVLHGLSHARGRLVGWLDADLDIDPSAIVAAAARFADGTVDAVVGSKRHEGSSVVYPPIRRVYSWGFQQLVRLLFRLNVRDTQVGAKVMRRELIDTVGPLLLVKRFAFDLEVLAVGAEFGFDRVVESPVELHYRFTGTSINWRAVKNMLQDTLAIAYRIHVRHWYVRQYAAVQRARVDELMQPVAVARDGAS